MLLRGHDTMVILCLNTTLYRCGIHTIPKKKYTNNHSPVSVNFAAISKLALSIKI